MVQPNPPFQAGKITGLNAISFQVLQWARPRYYRRRPFCRDCHKESVPQQLKLMKYSCVAPSSAILANEQAMPPPPKPPHPTNSLLYYAGSLACLQLVRCLAALAGYGG